MKNSIIWSKWQNVLGHGDNIPQYIPEDEVTKFDNFDPEDNSDDLDESDIYESETNPVVVTPVGMIPINPFNDPTKVFNFWVGETNFKLSEKLVFIINNTLGVEVLDVFSPYRFRVAIGNNFKFQEVRQEIEKALDAFKEDKINLSNRNILQNVRNKIKQMISLHLQDTKFWQIYILPNQEIDFVATNDESVFQYKSNIYRDAKTLVGGVIVCRGDKF